MSETKGIEKQTPLYQEALVEMKKLREISRKEAEKSILEQLSPIIDQIISKEISGTPVLLVEQDEDPNTLQPVAVPNLNQNAGATAPMDLPVNKPNDALATSSINVSEPVATTPPENAAVEPVKPLPDNIDTPPVVNGASLAIPVPGPDGKITIDIEALFNATPAGSEPNLAGASITPASLPSTPEVAPTPEPTVPPSVSTTPENSIGSAAQVPEVGKEVEQPTAPEFSLIESWKNSVYSLGDEVDKKIKNKNISENEKEILKNKVFVLYEIAQKSKTSGEISKAILSSGEVLLELMFSKLKKNGNEHNSYNRQSIIKENLKMAKKEFKTLKEFAASLFAEEVDVKSSMGFDAGAAPGKVTNTTTLKDETPKKKSGNAGGVEDPGKVDSLKVGGAKVAESVHSEEEEEETVKENMTLESELMEMLSGMGPNMEEEGMTAVSVPETHGEEEGACRPGEEMHMMEGKDSKVKKESIQRKLNALKEEQVKLMKALKECGMGVSSGEPVNVNIKISVEGGEVEDVETMGDHDDEMIEIVPDHDEEAEEMDHDEEEKVDGMGSEEEEEGLGHSEEEEEETSMPMMKESKVSRENMKLRSQLAETQLLTARSLFVSKLFAEHNLSVGTKQKIVEYIDSAQTVEEAKAKYGRVKKMLAESMKPAPLNKMGTSSKPSMFKSTNSINENVSPVMNLQMNPNRWMHLAGIKKKSE